MIGAISGGNLYRKSSFLLGALDSQIFPGFIHIHELTRTQTLMAANAPIFIRRAMVEGHPAEGVLPSGVIAGVISDRPSCGELIERIMGEAEHTLAELAN